MGKKVLITGATGMVGGLVLLECLANSEIESVTSIVRRASGINHEKLIEVIHNDFTDYSAIKVHFMGVDIVYFCIGVYTGAVARDEFRKITVDYIVEFAKMLKGKSPEATFCFLSGAGADPKEKSRMMFAKAKGVAENFLIKQNFGALYIFRPAYIYPVTPRVEPNFSYRLSRKLYPVLKALMPDSVIASEQLANAIFKSGINGAFKTILENADIKKIR
ncbi:MAG: NAD(P)H-binding protein [Salinivirgaceae bacterium]|jgi:uncharacterized protein YbjT (DUF2867 family)|nr:NAD(P)H-binding protein [Salinivirgaceae bacterium]